MIRLDAMSDFTWVILLAVVGSAAFACFFSLLKVELTRIESAYDTWFLTGITHLGAGILVLTLWGILLPTQFSGVPSNPLFWIGVTSTIALGVIGKVLNFQAIATTDVSVVSALSALVPILAIGSGILILEEVPSPIECLGIAIVCLSIFGFFIEPGGIDRDAIFSRGVMLAILSTIPTSFAVTTQKLSVIQLDALHYTLIYLLGVGTSGIGVSLIKGNSHWADILRCLTRMSMIRLFVLLAVAQFCIAYASNFEKAASLSAMFRLSIVFQTVAGYYLLRERKNFFRRVFFSLTILIGFCLLATRP